MSQHSHGKRTFAPVWPSLRFSRRTAVLIPFIVAALFVIPSIGRGQTFTWDPLASGSSGSDGAGFWDFTAPYWYNGSAASDTGWVNGADAVIGAGGALSTSPAITLDAGSPVVLNSLTFNALDPSSTTGYTLVDSSGTGASPLGIGASNSLSITNNAVGVTTTINANIVSNGANPFTLNILGGGNLAMSNAIGVSSGANNAAGTLRVGSSPGTGYTGTLTLSAANNLSSVTINSGTVSAIPASLGSGPVTLAGGTLSIGVDPNGSIAMNVATSQTSGTFNTMNSSMSAAGVVPVSAGNWNNLKINRGTTPQKGAPGNGAAGGSTLPFTLNNGAGVATTAQVVNWWGSNTFNVGNSTTNGTQQMFSSGLNANGNNTNSFGSNQSSFTLSGIPYPSYNVFLYYFNNTANSLGQAVLETGSSITAQPPRTNSPTGIGIAKMVTPTFANPNTSYPTYFYNTGGTAAPTTYTQSTLTSLATNSTPVSDYVEWTGVTGSALFVGVQEDSGGTPWIAGIEIVPTSSAVSNPLSATSSSTLNLAGSVSLTGGTTITSSGTPTVLSVTGSGNLLDLGPSMTTFSGVGGTLSPAGGVTVNLGPISDGGSGFSTAGSGTVVLTADNTSTVTGPVTIGGAVRVNMASNTVGSATGTGSVTIASGGSLTGNGIVSPAVGKSLTVASGGSIVAPVSGTLRVNGTAVVNGGGLAQAGAGALTFAGATTFSSGSNLTVGVGQLITASGGLSLGGATSTFTITSTATTSPFVNIGGGTGASSLAVSGSNPISILLSGNPNTQAGSTTTYDLFNYTGTDLAPTGSGSTLTFAGGGTLSVGSPVSGGLPQADQLSLVDVAGTGGNPNQILLKVLVPGPITWTGATNGKWDGSTVNWATAQSPSPTQYADGEVVSFGDTNAINSAPIINSNITIVPAQVSPASITFNNNSVNYSFSGGAISGASGGVILNGPGSVTLNNANTFVGAVAVNAGQLILDNATALGNTSGVTVASGGALVLNNTSGTPATFSTPAAGTGTIPLSIGGAGLTANPAGALVSLAGNNTYNGAITLTAGATINSASSVGGDGLTLGGSINTTGNNYGLMFSGPGNTTASGVISGGGGLTMAGSGTLTLSGVNTFTGGVQINSGGTVQLLNSNGLGATTSVTVAAGGALALQGGISIPAAATTLAGAGVASNPAGALNSTGGANSFAGPITLAGNTTIGSSSSASGDGLTLLGGINTSANNYSLTFAGAGNTAVRSAISGSGNVTMNGGGTLSLTAANSYAGGTVINSGVVAVSASNNVLGSSSVTLAGGTLRFQTGANVVGVHIAADGGTVGSSTGEQPELLGPTATAGVVPINNWNDFVVTRFTNGGDKSNTNLPQAQSIPTTPTPFTLNNSGGTASTAQVTAWQANNSFSTYGAPQSNPDAQLVNGFIGAINSGTSTTSPVTFPAKMTISGVPLSDYSVYVYFNNDRVGQNAEISLTSGSYTSSTYYVKTEGAAPLSNGVYTYTPGTSSTVAGTYTPSNYVQIPVPVSGTNSSFTVTLSSPTNGGNTPGIAAIELVPNNGLSIANAINVTSDSTIDVSGAANATAGNLSIGAQTLNITGSGLGAGNPYTMNLGATTLTGNATFNVANNSLGSGTGTLRLGAVGGGFGITLNNTFSSTGTVVLTAGGTYSGATNVNGGTLRVNGAVSGAGLVTVNSGGTLSGPTTSGASGSLAGATTVQSGGVLSATNGATLAFTGGLTLAGGSSSSYSLSGTPNGTADPAAAMIVTSGGAGPRSVVVGTSSSDVHTINLTGAPSPLTTSTFDLLSYTGTPLASLSSAPGTFTLGTTPAGPFSYQLVNNASGGGGQIDLVVTGYPVSWTGFQGSTWDTAGTNQNFAAMAPTPFYCAYVDPAIVTFGDRDIVANTVLSPQTITIQSGGVRPTSVTFTNTGIANGGTDYTFANDTNPATAATDTAGIAGSTGITLNGNGTVGGSVTFLSANSFTGPVQVNLGTLVLGAGNALGSSSGVTVAAGGELDFNTTTGPTTFGNAVNGSGKISLTLGSAAPGSAVLNNVAGIDTYAGPITLAGNATIASTSTSSTDLLTLSGGISTTASGYALTFTGAGNTTVSGAISGTGSVTYNGTAVLTLSAANSYSGGTSISAGQLVTKNAAALGTGLVTLSGGNLSFGGTTATIAPGNPFAVTSAGTIDITGPTSVTIGTLQLGPTTLSVTGGGAGNGTNYSLATGAVTLTGSTEFDISNNANGSGTGTLRLGAVADGGNGYGVTINNNSLASPGTVAYTSGGSYSGPTTVNAGTLQVNGTVTGAGAMTVASSAVLSGPVAAGGSGSLAGAVTVSSNGTIAATNGATFSLSGGLTLTNGSSSSFNLTGSPNGTASPTAALIATSGGGPRSLVTGATSGDSSVVNLTGTPFAQPGTWTYDLISYTGTPLSASPSSGTSLTFADGTTMSLGTIPSGPYTNVQLVNNPGGAGGQIDLQVTSYPITWSGGSNGNAWDTTTFNWAFAPPSGVSSINYVEGAYVTFADNSLFGAPVANSSGIATVNVQSTGVNPGSIAFTNAGAAHSGVDYVVNGGSIGGAATVLTKTGSGPVTINTANTYSGGTVINGGTVVAGQPTSLGTGPVTLAGGTLRLGTNLSGFGGTSTSTAGTATWTVNSSGITGNPISSDVLTLTDNGGNEARSAFYNVQAPIVSNSSGFSAQFTYTAGGNKAADGIAFILQNSTSGTAAIGQTNAGSALGYGGTSPITPSVAFEMNIFSTNTVGVAWKSNGAIASPYTAVSGVNLASGDPIRVQLNYNQANTTLTAILTDTVTHAVGTFSNNSLNVANILGQGTAYVGFSGADGGSASTQTVGGFTYATTGASANDVVISPSMTSTIDVAASTLASGYTLGNLTVGAGGPATLNVTASAAAPNQSYSLTLGSVALNSSANLNVASNGAGGGVLRVLGPVNDGGAGKSLTLGGPGTVNLAANSSYSGGTTVSGGTLAIGLSNNPAGNGTITLAGGNLQLYGQTSGTPVTGLTTAFYNGPTTLSTGTGNDPNFATLPALLTYVSSQTPAAVSVSTAGGMTTLNWPNVSNGKLFTAQGFTAATNYEAVIAGTLEIAKGGSYTFQTGSDDGTMLYIDGSPAAQVSNNGNHGFTTVTSSPITLTAGVHSIVIGYFQGGGGAQLLVNYSGPDTGNVATAIPDTALLTSSAAAFPSASQTYTNNVTVTSNATINVTGSLAATVGNLTLPGTTLSLASSDLSGSPYSLSVGSLNVSGASGANVAASASNGAGTLRVTAAPTFAAGSSLTIAAGKVQFNVSSGSATVGAGASVTVNSGATLELAGSTPALASATNKVNVVNNSSTAGLVVSGTNQVVGAIDGSGTTQVNAGSDLTADHIIQAALVIGGTAGSPGLVTIDASDANGNSLAMSSAMVVGRSTAPSGSLASSSTGSTDSTGSLDLSSGTSGVSVAGGSPISTPSALGGVAGAAGTAAVPEPSAILLVLLGVAALLAPILRRARLSLAGARR